MTLLNTLPRAMALALVGALAAGAASAASFHDGSFDLDDYEIISFPLAGDVTTMGQTLTEGNPGAAFEDITSRPAGNGTRRATHYIVSQVMRYDPASDGAITHIDLGLQTFWQASNGVPLTSNGALFVLMQGDDLYAHAVTLPALHSTWLSAVASGLVAQDFALITNWATRATDPNAHPDFAGGEIRFGFATGLTTTGSVPAFTRTGRIDNFSVGITSAVPEPQAAALLALGLAGLGFLTRGKRAVRG